MELDAEQVSKLAASRKLNELIAQTYPHGRFVAVDADQIIADAESFDELTVKLQEIGMDSPEVLVVQAGVEQPDFVYILPLHSVP
jgi:hypothetical protein